VKRNKGFTLVELLITIAVIAVLVLLAAPRLLGYTDKAKVAELTVNTREIETAAERYYMDHDDWPRLTDEPYTKEEVNSFSEKIYNITGEEVNLDSDGNYYDIDFDKLKPYIDVPGEKANYILQNPVGKVYALYKPTEDAIKRLDKEEPLYEFDSFTFTNAGATGRFGPTQAQLNNAYRNTELEGYVISQNGIQVWTVPKSGVYKIEVLGAQGGGERGGLGAKMQGHFNLSAGESINIIVGQRGGLTSQGDNFSAGGGGGSFVFKNSSNTNPLIVAGGGGGQAQNSTGGSGNSETYGTNAIGGSGSAPYGVDGQGGKGGLNLYEYSTGGGGAGWLTDGQDGLTIRNPKGGGGKSPANGALGGFSSHPNNYSGFYGGFGGGGSNSDNTGAGGGGGGYSGGGGGNNYRGGSVWGAGGGGGSYNSGTNQNNSVGNTGHGKVVITYIGK